MNELAVLSKAMMQERKDIVLSILGGFIAGIAGVALFSASGYLISQTVFAPPLYTLIVLTSLVKMLGLLRAASRYGERLYSHRATFSMLSRLRTSFFAKLIPLTPGILNKNRSGDLLARIVGDVESLQNYFLRVAYPPIMVVMVFLATVLFTSAFSLWIALLFVLGMLVTAFVVPGIVLLGQRRIHGRVREQRAQLSTEVTEVLYGFRDLKVYGQLAQREQQLQQASSTLAAEQQRAAGHLLRGQSMHALVTFLISWGVLALGAYLIMDGALAGVFLAMLVMASLTVFEEAAAMATLPAYKEDSEHAAKRLTETVQSTAVQSSQPGGTLAVDHAVSIELSGVTFQYEGEWRAALRDMSLLITPGSKTAIVGPSGSGKSTIIDLLLKLRTPMDGDIRLNGISVKELDEASIWQAANVVLQQSHFFRGTIRDNLLLNGEEHTDEQLLEVLTKVQLPDTSLTDRVYEKGENLSDGEKQRLALARAMLRKGRLWLLDEPTSSLDYVTEQRVMKHLYTQAAHDTLLLICHRLTGLEEMDQIVVMDQGRVIETGSYPELMEQKGYFYEMKQIERQMIGEVGA
ncbi:thiol reductant ABC exporter subunit CydC [Paenibacillus glucanolyticus]|uniref:thiol reductant ABC exporter subunit CydC n=1 Tax=Paenibacillus TaxID=44249 RepID=UPI0003E22862|nr:MULTISPECIES: thiol reductant ABC exporter subunit CydC [Paenibacillus]AVV58371.1 thiol reductant ABC exporter subunit CydC [Paenibacillus glucanolyticus]AWP27533.1 thiol reductant ABC exporter subunit CydC [Paenibacillus sp. Cedars]ETT42588.1 cysteine ABC transporter permease/ATP-binding protein CydC [Paenibacillus sp. FSL R5-808]MCA4752247.1 thiol reductant ABC exporter subunit CydC [Mycolicibacterium fortuitum]